jgi:hypothetical protein
MSVINRINKYFTYYFFIHIFFIVSQVETFLLSYLVKQMGLSQLHPILIDQQYRLINNFQFQSL